MDEHPFPDPGKDADDGVSRVRLHYERTEPVALNAMGSFVSVREVARASKRRVDRPR